MTRAVSSGTGGVRQLAPGFHIVETSFLNVPLFIPLVLGDAVALIDAGVSSTPVDAVWPALQTLGLPESAIGQVFVTHGHHDHFGGLHRLSLRSTNLRIAAPRADVAWIEDRDKYYRELFLRFPGEIVPPRAERNGILELADAPTPAHLVLDAGDVLDVGEAGPTHVIAAGSHSIGHVAYHHESIRVLTTGDALQGTGTPLLDGTDAFPLYEDLGAYRDTLKRLSGLEFDWLCDAHRGCLNRGAAEGLIATCGQFPDTFNEQLLAVVREMRAPMPLAEISRSVQERHYPRANRGIQLYVTTNVHLQELVHQRLVEPLLLEGRKLWVSA